MMSMRHNFFRNVLLLSSLVAILQAVPAWSQTPATRDGQRDFDFEFGTWKTHVARLVHPLTGSTTWAQYDGITVVHKIWRGRANLVELDVAGPSGRLQLLSLRLYNPNARQWNLNSANSSVGTLNQPAIGEFANGRGEFFDQELLGERAILVRFVISGITADSCHFEQAFSADCGKTWEVNWIATDTRVKEGPDATPPGASKPGWTSDRW
jgi:hypothetical protein